MMAELAMTWKRTVDTVKNKIEVAKERFAEKLAESDR